MIADAGRAKDSEIRLTGLPPFISKSHLLFLFRQFRHALYALIVSIGSGGRCACCFMTGSRAVVGESSFDRWAWFGLSTGLLILLLSGVVAVALPGAREGMLWGPDMVIARVRRCGMRLTATDGDYCVARSVYMLLTGSRIWRERILEP